jgi:hypothetical protein
MNTIERSLEIDAGDIHRSEFEALRQEINNRTTIQNTFIAVELAALGAGLSFAKDLQDLLIGLAAVTSLLWLSFIHQSTMIFKIAAYIGLQLQPRLTAAVGEAVLQWEAFLRSFHGDQSRAIQRRSLSRKRPTEPTSELYPLILFGATPPLLMTLYVAARLTSGHGMSVPSWLAVAASALVWLYALVKVIIATRWARRVDTMISMSTTTTTTGRGPSTSV